MDDFRIKIVKENILNILESRVLTRAAVIADDQISHWILPWDVQSAAKYYAVLFDKDLLGTNGKLAVDYCIGKNKRDLVITEMSLEYACGLAVAGVGLRMFDNDFDYMTNRDGRFDSGECIDPIRIGDRYYAPYTEDFAEGVAFAKSLLSTY